MELIKAKKKEVAVILPYAGNKVLMQLRDVKENIDFPGQWGFFGGSIKYGETPKETAKRELFEEINYKPRGLHRLSVDKVPDLDGFNLYSYYCPLTIPVERIKLNEGRDLGLFSIREVMSKKLYSNKMKKSFPVIDSQYIAYIIKKLLNHIRLSKISKNWKNQ